jgi:chromosome segregation ATPase
MGDRIRKVLGDISAFDSRDALQARLEDIAGEYDEIVSERKQRVEESHSSAVEALQAKIAELESDLEEAQEQIAEFEKADEEAQERYESKIDALVQKHKSELSEMQSALSESLETAKQFRSLAESKDSGNVAPKSQKKSSISKDKKITSIYSDEEGDDEDNDEDDEKEEAEKEGGSSGRYGNAQNSNLPITQEPNDHSGPKSQSSSSGSSSRKMEVQKILSTLPSSTRTVDYERWLNFCMHCIYVLYVSMYVYMYVYMYVCMYVCMSYTGVSLFPCA